MEAWLNTDFHIQVPQGSIIHPSVYFLLFEHASTLLPLNKQESKLQQNLSIVERKMLGTAGKFLVDYGFWFSLDAIYQNTSQERWPIRILVCGNAGVGKSTLINKVFGVPVVGLMDLWITISADTTVDRIVGTQLWDA